MSPCSPRMNCSDRHHINTELRRDVSLGSTRLSTETTNLSDIARSQLGPEYLLAFKLATLYNFVGLVLCWRPFRQMTDLHTGRRVA